MAYRPLSGEELLSVFSRKEPNKLQLAETITQLADENAQLRQEQRKLQEYILREQSSGGKSDLEWINNARLAGAHLALTTRGASYANAATTLISWRPAIKKLLRQNRGAMSFTDEERIIQLRKNFHSGRATKNRGARFAYQYASETINQYKGNSDLLQKLAISLILAIDL